MTNQDTDQQVVRMELHSALLRFREYGTLSALTVSLQKMRAVAEALGYKHGYGHDIEYDITDDVVRLNLHVVDDDFDAIPDMRATFNMQANRMAQAEVVEGLATAVINLPTLREYKRAQWREKAIRLAEEGENLNVGVEYTQVLLDVAKRLATNVISLRKDAS